MRSVNSFILVLMVTVAGRTADPSSLKGTWVREIVSSEQAANQLMATFTDSRLTVAVCIGAVTPKSDKGFFRVTMSGDYAVTKSGIVCVVVSGFEVDVTSLPKGADFVDPISPAMLEMVGHPFCFRATIENGVMCVSEIKVPCLAKLKAREGENGVKTVLAMAGGAYKSSKNDAVPFPKLTAGKGSATPNEGFPLIHERVEYSRLPDGKEWPYEPTQLSLPNEPKLPWPAVCPEVPLASPEQLSNPKPTSMSSLVVMPVNGMVVSPPLPIKVPPSPWEGTWYREMIMPGLGGGQVTLSFKGDRLRIRFVEFGYGDANEIQSRAVEYNCSFFRGADDYVVGRCLGVDIDVKHVPENEFMKQKQTEFFGGVRQAEGDPFSFRCEWRDGELMVSDIRMKLPGEGSTDKYAKDLMTALTSGRYKTAASDMIPLPKLGPKKELAKGQLMPVQQAGATEPYLPASNIQPWHPTVPPSGMVSPRMMSPSLIIPQGVTPPQQLPPPGIYRAEPIPESLRKQWEESTRPAQPVDPARKLPLGSPSRG